MQRSAPSEASEFLVGESRVEQDVAEELERLREPTRYGAQGDEGGIERRTGTEAGAKRFGACGNLEGIAGLGPLGEHRQRQVGRAGLGETVGGTGPAIHQQSECATGRVVPFREDDFEAVRECCARERR